MMRKKKASPLTDLFQCVGTWSITVSHGRRLYFSRGIQNAGQTTERPSHHFTIAGIETLLWIYWICFVFLKFFWCQICYILLKLVQSKFIDLVFLKIEKLSSFFILKMMTYYPVRFKVNSCTNNFRLKECYRWWLYRDDELKVNDLINQCNICQVLSDLVQGEFMQLGALEDEVGRFRHYTTKTFKKTASLIAYSCQAVLLKFY